MPAVGVEPPADGRRIVGPDRKRLALRVDPVAGRVQIDPVPIGFESIGLGQ